MSSFAKGDTDHSGKLTEQEYHALMGGEGTGAMGQEELREWKNSDKNNDNLQRA